jgi:hypothetical protein
MRLAFLCLAFLVLALAVTEDRGCLMATHQNYHTCD